VNERRGREIDLCLHNFSLTLHTRCETRLCERARFYLPSPSFKVKESAYSVQKETRRVKKLASREDCQQSTDVATAASVVAAMPTISALGSVKKPV
jgi:hypothetical protein